VQTVYPILCEYCLISLQHDTESVVCLWFRVETVNKIGEEMKGYCPMTVADDLHMRYNWSSGMYARLHSDSFV
jgi:hypothetical protein